MKKNYLLQHKENNKFWFKIHKKSLYSQYPNNHTISLFENRFKNKNLKILELGCGSGNDQIYFRKKYYDVTGIDISPDAIKNAKKTYSRKIS